MDEDYKLEPGMLFQVVDEFHEELRQEPFGQKNVFHQFAVREWLAKRSLHFFTSSIMETTAPVERSLCIERLLHELDDEASVIGALSGHYLGYMTESEQTKAILEMAAQSEKWRAVREWLTRKLEEALNAEGKPMPEELKEGRHV